MQKDPYNYNLSILDDVKAFCKPLYAKGINHFGFLRIYKNKTLRITDRADWMKTYYEKEYYNDSVLYQDVDCLNYGDETIKFLTNEPCTEHEKRLIENGMWHFLLKYKRRKDHIDFFFLSGDRNNPKTLDYYINNMEFINEFSDDFVEKVFDCIKKNKQNVFINTNLDVAELPKTYEVDISSGGKVLVSPREKECWDLVKKGFPSKKIASEMEISPRTVDKYIEILKRKLKVFSRSELM